MLHSIDPAWLLLIPFLIILALAVWVLWSFSDELRAGKRRRIRRTDYTPEVRIYWPDTYAPRFRRRRDKEAV
jgi:hypothetical protein